MALSLKHFRVLKALNDAEAPLATRMLPNGHGHACMGFHASPRTLDDLHLAGLIVGATSPFGWRWAITDAGRAALTRKDSR